MSLRSRQNRPRACTLGGDRTREQPTVRNPEQREHDMNELVSALMMGGFAATVVGVLAAGRTLRTHWRLAGAWLADQDNAVRPAHEAAELAAVIAHAPAAALAAHQVAA